MPKRNLIWILIIVAIIVAATWLNYRQGGPDGSAPSRDFAAPRQAYRLITERYADDVDPRELQQQAIEGMVESLDGLSSYVPPSQVVDFRDHMEGVVHGYGLELADDAGQISVVAPVFGSPAHRAGLAPGDRIVTIDEAPTAGMGLRQIHQLLADPQRSPIRLTVVRGGETLDPVVVRREEFEIASVNGFWRCADGCWSYAIDDQGPIVYIRVEEFVEQTVRQLQQALRQVPWARAIVLDLRDNPGGILPAAVGVADLLIADGPIVTVLSPRERPKAYVAHDKGTHGPIPLAVLVNGGTASAAEIVAGALKANRRAVLIGQPTRGKTSVQSMHLLPDNMGQINLTTARYVFASDGQIPDPIGAARAPGGPVRPHVLAEATSRQADDLRRQRLLRALGPDCWVTTDESLPATAPAGAVPDAVRQAVAQDSQLVKAIALLKTPGAVEALVGQAQSDEADR